MEETLSPVISSDEVNSKEPKKKEGSLVPIILIVLGMIEILYPLILLLTVVPQIFSLYKQMNTQAPSQVPTYGLLSFIVFLGLLNILYGVFLWREQKNQGSISASRRKIALVILILGILAFIATAPITITTVIFPIYNLTSQF